MRSIMGGHHRSSHARLAAFYHYADGRVLRPKHYADGRVLRPKYADDRVLRPKVCATRAQC